jgi:hypothetical protein
LRRFDNAVADGVADAILELKAERELVSYRAPSSGDDGLSEKTRFLELCTLLAEVAQFNSELFEASLQKHANPDKFQLLSEYAEKIAGVEIEGRYLSHIDCAKSTLSPEHSAFHEDWARGRLFRRVVSGRRDRRQLRSP